MTYDQVFASRHLIRSVSLRITMGEINGRQRSFVSADPHGRRTSILLFVGMLRRSKACLMPWYTCYSEGPSAFQPSVSLMHHESDGVQKKPNSV